MILYHRTCLDGLLGIEEGGWWLKPNRQPVLRDRRLIWLASIPNAGRLALGLTSKTLGCDRMEVLLVVETEKAIKWTKWANQNGVAVNRLGGTGARPGLWWILMEPVLARPY